MCPEHNAIRLEISNKKDHQRWAHACVNLKHTFNKAYTENNPNEKYKIFSAK